MASLHEPHPWVEATEEWVARQDLRTWWTLLQTSRLTPWVAVLAGTWLLGRQLYRLYTYRPLRPQKSKLG